MEPTDRIPLVSLQNSNGALLQAVSPSKIAAMEFTDRGAKTPSPAKQAISAESVKRNAAVVLQALDQSPPAQRGSDLYAAMEAAASPQSGAPSRVSGEESVEELMHGAASTMGSEAQLLAALEALDSVQRHAAARLHPNELTPAADQERETPGQRLAVFLKEQLLQRENERLRAQAEAAQTRRELAAVATELAVTQAESSKMEVALRRTQQALHHAQEDTAAAEATNEELCGKLEAARALAREHSEAAEAARGEAEMVQRRAAIDLQAAWQRIATLEDDLRATNAGALASQHAGASSFADQAVHSNADTPVGPFGEPAETPASPVSDVFGGVEASPFRPQGRIAAGAQEDRGAAREDDDAASSVDTDDTISEAAAAVHSLVRTAALRGRREEDAGLHGAPRSGALADRLKQHAAEERHLRSEIDMLERKSERGNQMLLKANHAIRVLTHKLQKERRSVAGLHEEKCLLQAQLLAAASQHQSGLDPEQLGTLLQELAACRHRVEELAQDRAALAAQLGAAHGQLEAADEAAVAAQQAAERSAGEALAGERARSAALEGQVQELVTRLGTSAVATGHLQAAAAALHDAQVRCGELAAQLADARAAGAASTAEVERVAELAQVAAEDAMAAREECQAERAKAERLAHENAGMAGRLESMHEAIARLDRADGVMVLLAGDKAELQGRLRQAEATADAAKAATEAARAELLAQRAATREVEQWAESLRGEVVTAGKQSDALQAAAEGAATQLAELSASHEALQLQLEAAAAEAEAARTDAASTRQQIAEAEALAAAVEQREQQLSAALQEATAHEEALEAGLQELSALLQGAHAESEALHAAGEALRRERDEATGRVVRLQATVAALEAEGEALRRAGTASAGENQALVDGMCDMTGLIDAVAALQQRNRLLQEESDATAARAAGAETARDAGAVEGAALRRDLEADRERLAAVQAAHEILQQGHETLRAEHAVATRQLAAMQSDHRTLRAEHAALLERALHLKAASVAARADAERARCEAAQVAAAAKEVQQQAAASQGEVRSLLTEKEHWLQRERTLREEGTAANKARSLAEGKLVLARQREEALKEASQQLRLLQRDIESHLEEAEVVREERDAAEERCGMLTERCLALQQEAAEAQQALDSAHAQAARQEAHQTEDVEQLRQEALDTRADLDGARAEVARLEEALAALPPLRERLARAEAELHESAQWVEGMSTELAGKADEAASLKQRLANTERAASALQAELAALRERLMAAEAAGADAEGRCSQARSALHAMQSTLLAVHDELDTLRRDHADANQKLGAALADRDACSAAASSAEASLQQLRTECTALQEQAAGADKETTAERDALQQHLAQLEATFQEVTEQRAAAEAARREQTTELQAAVQAGSAACASLAAKLEAASQGQKDALDECALVKEQARERQEEVHRLATQLEAALEDAAAAQAARDAAKSERDAAAAAAAAHARTVELVEGQCDVLRRQLDFLQASQSADVDLSEGIRRELTQAYDDQRVLRERLGAAHEELAQAQARQAALEAALQCANDQQVAAEERTAAVLAEAAAARAAAAAAEAAASEAVRRSTQLVHQVELADLLREQGQREVEVAREQLTAARADALAARQDAAAAAAARSAADAEMERCVREASAKMAAQMTALERIEAAAGAAASSGALQAAAASLHEVQQGQLDAWGGAAPPPALHHQRESLLQRLVQVHGAVGRLAGVAQQAEATAAHTASSAAAAQETRVAEVTAAAAAAAWQAERRAMRAVCKLALAVTMDQVGGSDDAAAVAAELSAAGAAPAADLQRLGLHHVWDSLQRLAAGGNGRRAAEEMAQLRTEHAELLSRCGQLEELADQLQQAGAIAEQRVECAERSVADIVPKVEALAASIRWAVGDFAPSNEAAAAVAVAAGGDSQRRLPEALEELSQAVQRVLRKYRTLSRHLTHVTAGGSGGSDDDCEEAVEGGDKEKRDQRTARAMGMAEEARRRSATIADKLESMLTPLSRAAAGNSVSRAIDAGTSTAALAAAPGGVAHKKAGAGEAAKRRDSIPAVHTGSAWGEEDVPLRSRFAAAGQ